MATATEILERLREERELTRQALEDTQQTLQEARELDERLRAQLQESQERSRSARRVLRRAGLLASQTD